MKLPTLSILLFSTHLATAGFIHEPVSYELDGVQFEGTLIYHAEAKEGTKLPGVFMIPNWMGPDNAASIEKAEKVAGDEFAVFVADMYGVDVRPTNGKEAGKAAGFVRADRALMRARAQKSVDVFHGLADKHPIDKEKTLAIGFCFGGGALLELARSGTDSIDGVVSFHGDLVSPTLEADAKNIKIPLLVLHGADDPVVPQTDVQAFVQAMQDSKVEDWQLVQFSGAVHSFTNPTAKSGGARYHERTAKRSFEMMEDFAEEVLELEN